MRNGTANTFLMAFLAWMIVPASPMAAAPLLFDNSPQLDVIEVRSWVEPFRHSYAHNEPLHYKIYVRWRLTPGVALSVLQTPELENLKCAGYSASQISSVLSEESVAHFHFTFLPIKNGKARIGTTYLETNLAQAGDGQQIPVEGVSLQIGREGIRLFSADFIFGGVTGVILFGTAFMFWRQRRKRPSLGRTEAATLHSGPLLHIRNRLTELDGMPTDGACVELYGLVRDLLAEALKHSHGIKTLPSTGEFSDWLDQQDERCRFFCGPALALLEQVERVCIAGWMPRPEENRAIRKELELTLDRLELAIREANASQEKRKKRDWSILNPANPVEK